NRSADGSAAATTASGDVPMKLGRNLDMGDSGNRGGTLPPRGIATSPTRSRQRAIRSVEAALLRLGLLQLSTDGTSHEGGHAPGRRVRALSPAHAFTVLSARAGARSRPRRTKPAAPRAPARTSAWRQRRRRT